MKKENKGFSLVELVIAITLLVIVSSILLGFMTTGSNMFRRISTDVSLQMESQVAMAQLREYIIDCNDTLLYDSSTGSLTIRNSGPEEHVFVWNAADGIIRYNGDPLAEHVSDFHLTQIGGAVEIVLVFSRQSEVYHAAQTINLRNDTVQIEIS